MYKEIVYALLLQLLKFFSAARKSFDARAISPAQENPESLSVNIGYSAAYKREINLL